jgi:hypothetical protein
MIQSRFGVIKKAPYILGFIKENVAYTGQCNPQFYKNVRHPDYIWGASNITDVIYCNCCHTTWALKVWDNDKPENLHRRANRYF